MFDTQAYLEFSKDNSPGTISQMALPEMLTLGRESSWPGTRDDESVAERHARVEKKDSGYLIRDLRSSSGTYVNGTRISEAWLQEGDEIQVGNSFCYFTFENETSATDLGLKSKSPDWTLQLQRMGPVAKSAFPVLLLGPSGTGKEVIAEKIHSNSPRRMGPFVRVNCSALTETLVESELFGHVKGSFTGAIADRKGAFETARGGTLFLDEIGDLPYGLQAKLLRALENNEIRPVGSDKSIQTDVRIVAATHQNLVDKIHSAEFRMDLYYRLNVVNIRLPALVDRMDDFDELLYTFARQYRVRFSFNAIQKMKKHQWPGNIRELKNTVARASAFFPRIQIEEEHVEQIVDRAALPEEVRGTVPGELPVIKEIERQMIIKRLVANRGNQRRTAADLGMPKSTLHDRLKLYNIDPRQYTPGYTEVSEAAEIESE